MRGASSHALPPSLKTAAFTLTEVVLSLAIIATALIALIGLLPVGIDSSRRAVNHTIVATVLEDLHNRLEGENLKPGAASFSPAFYDDAGVFIPADAADIDLERRLYRAEVNIGKWEHSPTNTAGLRPVTIRLYWPIDSKTGEPLGKSSAPQTVITYAVTTLTGPDWEAIDRNYTPKIGF